jgi:hypothetical protein
MSKWKVIIISFFTLFIIDVSESGYEENTITTPIAFL